MATHDVKVALLEGSQHFLAAGGIDALADDGGWLIPTDLDGLCCR